MATLANADGMTVRVEKFFPITAILMALVLVGGFSLNVAMGRSTFAAPLVVHIHAFIFFGWTVLFVTQTMLASTGSVRLHRKLGWLSLIWIPAMVVMGLVVTALMVRRGGVPFFFTPLEFLVMDWLSILTFAGLAAAAIVMRRQTDWHRRLMLCGMAVLTGPGFGRLLPMPFLIPHAVIIVFAVLMLFPTVGVLRDLLRRGRVHPAWGWGIGAMLVSQAAITLIPHTSLGLSLYDAVTAGSPGTHIAPSKYPPFPAALLPHD